MSTAKHVDPAHGTVWKTTVAGVEYTFRRPSRADWRRIRALELSLAAGNRAIANDAAEGGKAIGSGVGDAALEMFESACRFCVVSHSLPELEAQADRYFDLFEDLGGEILVAIKGELEDLGKGPEKPGA